MDNDEWIFIPASAKSSRPHGHPLPVPQSKRQNMPRSIGTQLQLGGLPLPPSRPRPKSVQGKMPNSPNSERDTQLGNSANLRPVSPPVLSAPNFPKEKRSQQNHLEDVFLVSFTECITSITIVTIEKPIGITLAGH